MNLGEETQICVTCEEKLFFGRKIKTFVNIFEWEFVEANYL